MCFTLGMIPSTLCQIEESGVYHPAAQLDEVFKMHFA